MILLLSLLSTLWPETVIGFYANTRLLSDQLLLQGGGRGELHSFPLSPLPEGKNLFSFFYDEFFYGIQITLCMCVC